MPATSTAKQVGEPVPTVVSALHDKIVLAWHVDLVGQFECVGQRPTQRQRCGEESDKEGHVLQSRAFDAFHGMSSYMVKPL
ncbi:hypothetical protein [Reyranella sp.]|uniref:hypothetical protein n=1 Tax=Reyranella sp. TaxID=1929291 RepID=UPI003783C406